MFGFVKNRVFSIWNASKIENAVRSVTLEYKVNFIFASNQLAISRNTTNAIELTPK